MTVSSMARLGGSREHRPFRVVSLHFPCCFDAFSCALTAPYHVITAFSCAFTAFLRPPSATAACFPHPPIARSSSGAAASMMAASTAEHSQFAVVDSAPENPRRHTSSTAPRHATCRYETCRVTGGSIISPREARRIIEQYQQALDRGETTAYADPTATRSWEDASDEVRRLVCPEEPEDPHLTESAATASRSARL